jgi:hypothetical protein
MPAWATGHQSQIHHRANLMPSTCLGLVIIILEKILNGCLFAIL